MNAQVKPDITAGMTTAMSIGLGLPQIGTFADPAITRRLAVQAEQAGFDSLWVMDRVLNDRVLDPMLALTLAAAVTDRVRLGTAVLAAPLYSPVLLARSVASLDQISNGRFTLGLGLGRSTDEFAAVGMTSSGMQVRIEQMLEVLARVWRDDVVEIETLRETIAPSVIGLKPLQQPRVPLLLATSTPAGLERIGRRADGLIATALPLAVIASRWATVLQIAGSYGRDTSPMRLVIRAEVHVADHITASDRHDFVGSISQVRQDIERARSLGADEIILDLQHCTHDESHLLHLAHELTDGLLHVAAPGRDTAPFLDTTSTTKAA